MPWEINASSWLRQLTSPILDGNTPLALRPVASSAISMNLALSTAGRLGFFIDYSERETVGTHTFYAARTHGSTGAVGCTWTAYDSADGAQLATGSLSWTDQSLDVLSFTVDIASKPAGDHRIYVLLSAPTGGAVLHHGDSTVAYGIIDDDTIATNNAIFIDADAATDGNGTQASPYNNWYSARDALVATDRYIYIKGLMIPDSTDNLAMSVTVKHFALKDTFEGRVSESQRLVIRNWPTFTGGIDGGSQTDCAGFALDGAAGYNGSLEYITFRRLSAVNLDNTDGGTSAGKSYFLRTRGGSSGAVTNITAERITVDGIVSGANAATAAWFSQSCSGFKMWRWDINNTTHAAVSHPLISFECYGTDNVSIQRCSIGANAGGFYEKEGFTGETKVGLSARFNYMNAAHIRVSTQSDRAIQDFHIIQNNIFDSMFESHSFQTIVFDMINNGFTTSKVQISNNVFYNYAYSTYADINIKDVGFEGVIVYNNIHFESKRPLRFDEAVSPAEYIDYNHFEFDGVTAPIFHYLTTGDYSLSEFQAETTFADNSTSGNPLFTDAVNGDFTVQAGSSALVGGVDGTQQGAYLGNFYSIGAN